MKLQNKQEIIQEFKRDNNIMVLPMRKSDTSLCYSCKTKEDKYAVFIGGTKFSDLLNTVCSECLHTLIDNAAELRDKYIKDGIESINTHFKNQAV